MPGPDGRIGHAELKIGDSVIMLADENPQMGATSATTIGNSPVSLLLYVPDVDRVVEKALAEGGKSIKPVQASSTATAVGFYSGSVWAFLGRGDACGRRFAAGDARAEKKYDAGGVSEFFFFFFAESP